MGGTNIKTNTANFGFRSTADASFIIDLESGLGGGNDITLNFKPEGNGSDDIFFRHYATDDSRKGMVFAADDAADKVFQPTTDSNFQLGTTSRRWSNLWADSINGADIGFLNGQYLTESINHFNESDICLVDDPMSKKQRKAMSVIKHDTYQDYFHVTDNPYSEEQYNLIRSKLIIPCESGDCIDLRMGRKTHGCWKEMNYATAMMRVLISERPTLKSLIKEEISTMRNEVYIIPNIPDVPNGDL